MSKIANERSTDDPPEPPDPNDIELCSHLADRIETAHGGVPFVLLLNKHDLLEEWDLKEDLVGALRGRGWDVLETSALAGDGVEEAFALLTTNILATTAA